MSHAHLPPFLRLEPQYRERVWGGTRLKRQEPRVGEAWIAYEDSRVLGGPQGGRTVGDLARDHAEALLGEGVARRFSGRFPLLIKLLDCDDWLSVQVHPDDAQAERLVGPGQFGKTEAWHFLEVDSGSTILAGVRAGTSRGALVGAIRSGRVLDVAERRAVRAGESVFIPAGTLHALGPGMLLYEIQQLSDTTYRVYDWDRPPSAGRALHLEESAQVTDPDKGADVTAPPVLSGTAAATVVACPFFELDVVQVHETPFTDDPQGRSPHVLTVIEGEVEVRGASQSERLGRHESVLIPAASGAYELQAVSPGARVLRGRVG